MLECEKIWKNVLSEITNTLSTISYDLWFSNVEPLTIHNDKLVIVVPLKTNKTYFTKPASREMICGALADCSDYVKDYIVITPDEKSLYEGESESSDALPDEYGQFNKKYTFDSFVVGSNSIMAYTAALSVAKNPGESHNPLFIYGGVGLGKTHILQAIGNYVKSQNAKTKILYITTEQFINDFIESIKNNKDGDQSSRFREKYRGIDILMMDDIQFISNKISTQEALFHTFNDLYLSGKQIIISSDRHPSELTFLQDRLKSRFQSGLTVDISKPDIETRIAILQKKAFEKKCNISKDVIYFIAEKIDSNIRELEGALSKVIFYCSLVNKEPNLDTVLEALKDDIDATTHILSIDSIVDATCLYFNVSKQDVIGKKKNKPIVEARQIAIYIINDLLGVPLASIGHYFGGRDHTTIIYARDKITELLTSNNLVSKQVNDIKSMVQKK